MSLNVSLLYGIHYNIFYHVNNVSGLRVFFLTLKENSRVPCSPVLHLSSGLLPVPTASLPARIQIFWQLAMIDLQHQVNLSTFFALLSL